MFETELIPKECIPKEDLFTACF